MLVRAKILKVNTRFHTGVYRCAVCHPLQSLQFFTKNILRIQYPINLPSFLFIVPCNQQES